MIVAVNLDKVRRDLFKLIQHGDEYNKGTVITDDLWKIDRQLKEIMDELDRRENPKEYRQQG